MTDTQTGSTDNANGPKGLLSVVGIGPGAEQHMTPAARQAIEQADLVIGYRTYIQLVRALIKGKERIKTGMTEEIGRARMAIEQAQQGRRVTLISSGDAGVYGMAGLVFEVLSEIGWRRGANPDLQIIPGMTAANACGSLVGAPLIHDSCTISLSDLLTPWPLIEKRLEHAAAGDFVISLYNPASGRRTRQIVRAREIIRQHRPDHTPVALVKSAYRFRQNVVLCTLEDFLDYEIGMLTTVIVGSTQTKMFEGYMVTPRGYQNKYDVGSGVIHEGQEAGISLALQP